MEVVLHGPLGRSVLGPAILTIGRARDNQLVMNDPKVSSHHAEIRPAGKVTASLTWIALTAPSSMINDLLAIPHVHSPLVIGSALVTRCSRMK